MSKRFTETEKWKDPWFCGLSEKQKLFWIYLVDNCDHAGIWQANWPLVDFYIKEYKHDALKFDGRILYISENKWFIKKFIDFQYNGKLNPENRTHKSVIDILEKEGAYKGLTSPMEGCKGTGTGTVLDKGTGIKEGIVKGNQFDFESLWAKYPKKMGKHDAQRHFKAQVKTDEDYSNIKKALDNFLGSDVSRGDPQFIPHGSTWFNNRWTDWINASNATGKSQAMIEMERMIQNAK